MYKMIFILHELTINQTLRRNNFIPVQAGNMSTALDGKFNF